MNIEDQLWKAFPTSEPVAAYEIASMVLIWEKLRETEEGRQYLQDANAKLVSGDELMLMRVND